MGLLILFPVPLVQTPLLLFLLPGGRGSASTTGMMATSLGGGSGLLLIPVELLLLLDLQYGGIVVQNGQNDLVHVLPQTQVDFLLLLQGLHQLRERRVSGFSSSQKVTHQQLTSVGRGPAEKWTGSAASAACVQYLISGGVVYFRSYGLSLGLRSKQRLGFIEAEAEDLAV